MADDAKTKDELDEELAQAKKDEDQDKIDKVHDQMADLDDSEVEDEKADDEKSDGEDERAADEKEDANEKKKEA